jgi:hypothetical protein
MSISDSSTVLDDVLLHVFFLAALRNEEAHGHFSDHGQVLRENLVGAHF